MSLCSLTLFEINAFLLTKSPVEVNFSTFLPSPLFRTLKVFLSYFSQSVQVAARYKIYAQSLLFHWYLLTYILNPWSRVILQKLTAFQSVKKFPAFYGNRRFITTFTSAPTCPCPEPARSSPYTPHSTS